MAGSEQRTGERQTRYISNGLVRGLTILRLFSAEHPELSLTDIARRLGETRAACYRYVYTLEYLGFLAQDPASKRYRLTPLVMELGFRYLRNVPLVDLARPEMEALRDRLGFSCHLGILDGEAVVYIARVASPTVTAVNVHVGSRLPVYATAMGKVLLAFQPEARRRQLLAGREVFPGYTPRTIQSRAALETQLARIRSQGIAVSDEEFEAGVRSVAVPILNGEAVAVGALNIAAAAAALTAARMAEAVPALRAVGERLSRARGFAGRYPAGEPEWAVAEAEADPLA